MRRLSFSTVVGLVTASLGLAMLAWAWRADREWFDTHMSTIYCAVEVKEVETWARCRIGGGVAGVLFVLALAPLLTRATRGRSWRSGIGLVLRIGVPAVLALVVCDVYLRWKHSAKDKALTGPPLMPATVPDPRYGWQNRGPATTVLQVDGHDVEYAINAHGDRARDERDLPDLDRPTIIVSGESIAQGIGLAWDDSFAAILARRTGLQVMDAATLAWAHDQAYLRVKDVLGELKHPIAVVNITVTQQLERDVLPSRERLALGPGGSFVTVHPLPEWWRASPMRELAQRIVPYHGDEAIDLARALIAATSREALDHGAYPLFVLTNWGQKCLPDDTGAPSVERRLFGGQDVRYVRVDLDPAWEDQTTHHPGARAHRILEEAIERVLVGEHIVSGVVDVP